MSFYVRRDHTIVLLLVLGFIGGGVYYLSNKSMLEKEKREEQAAIRKAKMVESLRIAEERRLKKIADREAKKAAEEAEELARIEAIKKEQAERKLREEKRLAKIEEEKRLAKIAQAKREKAWKEYAGTKYDEFTVGGKTYKTVTVISADAHGVMVSHEHGGRKFKYDELPLAIQKMCLYDPEYAAKKKAEEAAERKAASKRVKKEVHNSSSQLAVQTSPSSSPKEQVSKPRGYVTCRTVKQYSRYSSTHSKTIHFKDVEIKANANVRATIYVNGSPRRYVEPKVKQEFIVKSLAYGKYSVVLKDSKGNVLDSESNNRKSGLSGATLR